MFKHTLLVLVATGALVSTGAHAKDAIVHLDGDWYLQAGEVTNYRTENLTRVVYDLGTPNDGVAVWERWLSTGVHTNAYGTNHYSTETWTTSIAPGTSWRFEGLDMDTASAGDINSAIDTVGTTLQSATISLTWADGLTRSQPLAQTSWLQDQTLVFGITTPVPEPATDAMLLVGLGLLYFSLRRYS
jgi:hypothetical protein